MEKNPIIISTWKISLVFKDVMKYIHWKYVIIGFATSTCSRNQKDKFQQSGYCMKRISKFKNARNVYRFYTTIGHQKYGYCPCCFKCFLIVL
jgi:hypothetical protein